MSKFAEVIDKLTRRQLVAACDIVVAPGTYCDDWMGNCLDGELRKVLYECDDPSVLEEALAYAADAEGGD